MLATSAAIFSLLLILTGAAKVARPTDVERALGQLGLPGLPGIGFMIGGGEILVGVGALFYSSFLFVQGVVYLAFAIWVVFALRAAVPLASCGCLGRNDTPPTVAHLLIDLMAAGLSLGAVTGAQLDASADLAGVAQIAVIATGLFLSFIVLTDAAMVVGVRRT